MKGKFVALALSLLLAACLLAAPADATGHRRHKARQHKSIPSWRTIPTNYKPQTTGPSKGSNPTTPMNTAGNLAAKTTQTAKIDNDQKVDSKIFNSGNKDVDSDNINAATNVGINANVPINLNNGVAFSALDDPSVSGAPGNSAGNLAATTTQKATINNDQKINSKIVNTGSGDVDSTNTNAATNIVANVNVPFNKNSGVAFSAR